MSIKWLLFTITENNEKVYTVNSSKERLLLDSVVRV